MTKERTPTPSHPSDCLPIRSQADLDRHWRGLMGPLGFAHRQLWLNLIDDGGRPTPFLTQVDELPEEPDPFALDNLFGITARLIDEEAPGASLALLIARPGSEKHMAADLAWASALAAAARRNGVMLRAMYLATNVDIRIVAPDEQLPATA